MTHAQIPVQHNGEEILVDVGIAELLNELWLAGCSTEFSCQGRPEWDDNTGCQCDSFAYIAFVDFTDAKRFLNLLWDIPELDCQLEKWNDGATAVVRFDGEFIDDITEQLRREVL